MTIELIGTDTWPGSAFVNKTTLTSPTSVTVSDVVEINLSPDFEGDIVEFLNGSEQNYGRETISGSLVRKFVQYPSVASSFLTLFPELAAMRKKYVFLYAPNYFVEAGTWAENMAVNIVIDSYQTETDRGGSMKTRKYNFHFNRGWDA